MVRTIHRHKTAIGRFTFSRPIRLALESQLLNENTSLFDYGCGRGDDLSHLEALGISVAGWDPVHRPDVTPALADIVDLGYVVNVIEAPNEREDTLRRAWSLARQILMVSVRLYGQRTLTRPEPCGDGVLTGTGTFQKFYTQTELRDWLDDTLGQSAVAAAPGIFFVFRDPAIRKRFLASRFRREHRPPTPTLSNALYETHQTRLIALTDFFTERGRLPNRRELSAFAELESAFGNIARAFALVRQTTNSECWEQIRRDREQEVLIHLALDCLRGRPNYRQLPEEMQLDIRSFFGSYAQACNMADALLFSSGDLKELNAAMERSVIGKLTGGALYVHADAVSRLETRLRIYEGCARTYLGYVEEANIIKLHRQKPMVSYLSYPDFDTNPHPSLVGSLSLKLSDTSVRYLDYSSRKSPPILHRKEEFLSGDDARRGKFAQLTKQEERRGLFANPNAIGTREAWNEILRSNSVKLRGHQLIRMKEEHARDYSD